MRIIQAHTTVTIMTNIQYAQKLLAEQFLIKSGIFNRRAETLGFRTIIFYDAAPAGRTLLITNPIGRMTIAQMPYSCN